MSHNKRSNPNYVRVSYFDKKSGNWNREGGFIMRERDLYHRNGQRMSPREIKDKYALKDVPNRIADVNLPDGTRLIGGYVAANRFGYGGGRQYFINQKFLDEKVFRGLFSQRGEL